MKVQVLGSGCDRCKKLAANMQEAAAKLGLPCEIEKVTDINEITAFGVMMTPALAIDGKVVSIGKVLSVEKAAELMTPGAACEEQPAAVESPCCCCGGAEAEAEAEKAKQPACCSGGGSAKKWLTALLLLFVAASVAFVIVREAGSGSAAPAAETVPVGADALTVYYFHGNQRCMACTKIEELTGAAILDRFANEIAVGRVAFRPVNVEEPANEHFIKDFQLVSRTVVMAKGGKYEKFDAVWTLVRDPQKFTGYIQDGAAKMLAEQ